MGLLKAFILSYLLPLLISVGLGFSFWWITKDKPSSLFFALLVNLSIIVIFDIGRHVKASAQYLETYSPFLEQESLHQIASSLRQIESRKAEILRQVAGQIMDHCASKLAYLRADQWTLDSMKEFVDFSETLFSKTYTMKTYSGISVISDFSVFWQTPHGRKFLQQNHLAAKRGVEVRRIFIFDNETSLRESQGLLKIQSEQGIQVYYMLRGTSTGIAMNDYGIWDDTISAVLHEPRHLGAEFEAHFYLRGEKTRELSTNFHTLLSSATPLKA